MNPYKEELACDTAARTLEEAVDGADMLVGLSVKGAFTPELLKRMKPEPHRLCPGQPGSGNRLP